MQRKRVFINSVQSEFATERQLLFDYLARDALLGKFFEPFVFENIPALNISAANLFLNASSWEKAGAITVVGC